MLLDTGVVRSRCSAVMLCVSSSSFAKWSCSLLPGSGLFFGQLSSWRRWTFARWSRWRGVPVSSTRLPGAALCVVIVADVDEYWLHGDTPESRVLWHAGLVEIVAHVVVADLDEYWLHDHTRYLQSLCTEAVKWILPP